MRNRLPYFRFIASQNHRHCKFGNDSVNFDVGYGLGEVGFSKQRHYKLAIDDAHVLHHFDIWQASQALR